MTKSENRKLVLFDIDGTLISSGKGALASLKRAIEKHAGKEPEVLYHDTAGKTDRLIIRNLLRKISVEENRIPAMTVEIVRSYLEILPHLYNKENDARMFPGAGDIVRSLHQRRDIVLGLITGNVEEGARIKLNPFGLNQYFAFGAFGSDAIERDDLPSIARMRAEKFCPEGFDGDRVVIVGDTIHDVTCGRGIGARAIAVVRREENRKEILDAAPYFVCSGFDDYKTVIERIMD